MRIVILLLLALVGLFWGATWWLLQESIGAATPLAAPQSAPVADPPTASPSPVGSSAARAPLASAVTVNPARPAPATVQPTPRAAAPAPSPGFPPGTVVDTFADGGPRPAFVDPVRPSTVPPALVREDDHPLAPPARAPVGRPGSRGEPGG